MNLYDFTEEMKKAGYEQDDAEARVCQDIVLKALSLSPLSRNATIKGGVVMRSITNEVRRATQDMDIDFIKYSLADESIDLFIDKLNTLDGIAITRVGEITELSQQDYNGKRVFIHIKDNFNNTIESKIDLGVHKHFDIEQEEYCFDIAFDDEGASLLINSREQMFSEKLRSLLKFGIFSTRYKDIYDMFYQCGKLNESNLMNCFHILIFDDSGMRENGMRDVVRRIEKVFGDKEYKGKVDRSDKRWLDNDIDEIFDGILTYLSHLQVKDFG